MELPRGCMFVLPASDPEKLKELNKNVKRQARTACLFFTDSAHKKIVSQENKKKGKENAKKEILNENPYENAYGSPKQSVSNQPPHKNTRHRFALSYAGQARICQKVSSSEAL